MDIPLLREIVIIFGLSVVVIYCCHKVKVPPIVAFLITGIVCGPYGLGLVNVVHEVEILAEVGVVLLLFSIGMELSVSELIRLSKPVFWGGSAQVVLTIAIFALIAHTFNASIGESVFAGCLISLSSTAIVLKILQQQAQVDSPQGRIILSVLIYQDLIIVPMMLAVPFLAGRATFAGWDPLWAAGRTILIIGALFLLARKVVPWALDRIVRTRSRELFLISTLGICMSIAYLTSVMGLSLSLGAFLAGLILSESEYSHSALEGILPFRDVFTSLFFISVGMLMNTGYFFSHLPSVLLLTATVLLVKAFCAAGVGILLGYPLRPSIIVGLGLCQVGEFSFVLAKAGLDHGLFRENTYQLFLAAIILTMAATPFLLAYAPRLAGTLGRLVPERYLNRTRPAEEDELPHEVAQVLSDHLIIIGFGVGGKHLARAAKIAGIAYIILEMNPDTVRHYAGTEPIIHGDATHPAVLESLGARRARVMAIVISDPAATRGITEVVSRLNPGLHILVRTRFVGEVAALKALGASDVVPEEFETSIEVFTRVMARYLVPVSVIEHFTSEIRGENYDMLRDRETAGTSLGALQKHIPHLNVSSLQVEPGSSVDGLSLGNAALRQKVRVTVVAVQRGETVTPSPGGDFTFQSGDLAYVFAEPEDVAVAAELFRGNGTVNLAG